VIGMAPQTPLHLNLLTFIVPGALQNRDGCRQRGCSSEDVIDTGSQSREKRRKRRADALRKGR